MKGYGFKLIPKKAYKLAYDPIVFRPHSDEVVWSKSRAKREAEFFMNNFKLASGIPIKKAFTYRIIKLR